MTEKIVRIKIISNHDGKKGLELLNTQLDTADVKVKKLDSTLKSFKAENGDTYTAFAHSIELTSKNYEKLIANIEKAKLALSSSNTISTTIQRPLANKQEIFNTATREKQAKIASQTAIEIARIEGNKILEIKLQLAEKERLINKKTADDLQKLQEKFVTGQITFINSAAERNRILEVEQAAILSANRIANAQIAAHRTVVNAANNNAELQSFRAGNNPTAVNRELQLRAAALRTGNTQLEQEEIRSTHRIEDIRQAYANRLIAIERDLSSRTITLAEARNRRVQAVNNLRNDSISEQVRIAGIRRTEEELAANRRLAESHRTLAQRVFEVVGLYKIYNTVVSNVITAIQGIPRAGIELETTTAALTALTGATSGTASIMQFLEQEANRTGIAIGTVRETFRNFYASTSIAGESLQDTAKMFTNINTVVQALHLPAAKAEGIFNALAQIFNKTKVQSEELVKQLGNLLPGAFAAFAKANSKTTQQLVKEMKAGTVLAHDTILNFTEFYAKQFSLAAALADHGLNANIGRLQTAFTTLQEQLYQLSSGSIISAVQGLTSFIEVIKKDNAETQILGTAVKDVSITLGVLLVGRIALAVKNFFFLTNSFTTAGVAATRFQAILANNPFSLMIAGGLIWYDLLKRIKGKIDENNDAVGKAKQLAKEFYDAQREAQATKVPDLKTVGDLELNVDNNEGIKRTKEALADLYSELKKVKEEKEKYLQLPSILQRQGDKDNFDNLIREKEANILEQERQLSQRRTAERLALEAKAKENVLPIPDLDEATANMENAGEKANMALAAYLRQQQQYVVGYKRVLADFDAYIKSGKTDQKLIPIGRTEEDLKTAETFFEKHNQQIQILTDKFNTEQQQKLDDANNAKLAKQRDFNIKQIEDETANVVKRLQLEKAAYEQQINLAKVNQQPFDQIEANKQLASFDNDITKAKEAGLEKQIKLQNELGIITTTNNIKTNDYIKSNSQLWEQLNKNSKVEGFHQKPTADTGGLRMKYIASELLKAGFSKVGAAGVLGTIRGESNLDPHVINPNDAGQGKHSFGLAQWNRERLDAYKRLHGHALQSVTDTAQALKEQTAFLIHELKGNYSKGVNNVIANAGTDPGKVAIGLRGKAFEGAKGGSESPDAQVRANYARAAYKVVNSLGSGQDSYTKSSELSQETLTEVKRLEQEKLSLSEQRINDTNKYELEQAQYNADKKAAIDDLNNELAKTKGTEREKALAQIDIDYNEKKQALINKGLFSEVAKLDILKRQKQYEVEIVEAKRLYNLEEDRYTKRTEAITRQVQIGQLDQLTGTKNLIIEQKRHLEIQDKITKEWEKQVGLAGTEADKVDFLNEKVNRRKELEQQASGLFVQDTGDYGNLAKNRDTELAGIGQQANAQRTILGQDYPADLQQQSLVAYQFVKDQEVAITDAANQKKMIIEAQYYEGVAALTQEKMTNIGEGFQVMFGKQSAAARAAFAVAKAAAIGEAIMNTYVQATKAAAQTGIMGGIAAGIAIVSGMATVAKIQAQQMPAAHGGLDYVPAEQTYLLNKGERVLSPKQNKDITGYVQNAQKKQQAAQPVQQAKPKVTIHNHWGDDVFDSYVSSDKFESAVYNIIRRNN
jgi:tape measure domain-containing protein